MNVKALMLIDLLPRSSFGTQEMQWFNFKTLRLFGVSCFDSFFVLLLLLFHLLHVSRSGLQLLPLQTLPSPFFCGASKSPDVQARAFNLSVSARRCLLRVLPFSVISFSCLWALITFSFLITQVQRHLHRTFCGTVLLNQSTPKVCREDHILIDWLASKRLFFHFTQKLHKGRSCWCDPKIKVETGEQNNQITNLELSLFSFYLHVRVLSLEPLCCKSLTVFLFGRFQRWAVLSHLL